VPNWQLASRLLYAITGWRAEPRTTPGGQPWYSPLAILTALTLKAVFRLALRQAEGLIGSIIGLLGLALAVPDHSILSRRAKTLGVPRPQPRRNGEAVHRLVDSTGLRLCGAGEWLLEEAWHQDAPVVAEAAHRPGCRDGPDRRRVAHSQGGR